MPSYKDITYDLKRTKRKTASIYVERDGGVSVLVPEELSDQDVKDLLESKRKWIYRNLAEWEDQRIRDRDFMAAGAKAGYPLPAFAAIAGLRASSTGRRSPESRHSQTPKSPTALPAPSSRLKIISHLLSGACNSQKVPVPYFAKVFILKRGPEVIVSTKGYEVDQLDWNGYQINSFHILGRGSEMVHMVTKFKEDLSDQNEWADPPDHLLIMVLKDYDPDRPPLQRIQQNTYYEYVKGKLVRVNPPKGVKPGAYKHPVISQAEVEKDLQVLKERYAQAGIAFKTDIRTIDAPTPEGADVDVLQSLSPKACFRRSRLVQNRQGRKVSVDQRIPSITSLDGIPKTLTSEEQLVFSLEKRAPEAMHVFYVNEIAVPLSWGGGVKWNAAVRANVAKGKAQRKGLGTNGAELR